MKKLFVFIGESGSGKTRLINELIKRDPTTFRKVITYTSRPSRKNEVAGKDYYFYSKDFFVDNKELILTKIPQVGFCYGTKKTDLFDNSFNLLLTSKFSGIKKLLDLGFENLFIINISISQNLKIKRMKQRGDSEQLIQERLEIDKIKDFYPFKNVPILFLKSTQSIKYKVDTILKHIND